MEKVKEATLNMYPVTATNRESNMKIEASVWGECIEAIDESGRRLARPKKVPFSSSTETFIEVLLQQLQGK